MRMDADRSVRRRRLRAATNDETKATDLRIRQDELDLKRSEKRRDWVRLIVQMVGGLAIAATVVLTWQDLSQTRQTVARQLEIAESGQLTDRFSRAVDQLGNEGVDVRVGGIYALERIAGDSGRDRSSIAEVLTAFVGRKARAEEVAERADDFDVAEVAIRRMPDVLAATTVLGRMYPRGESTSYQLSRTDLRNLSMRNLNFVEANLVEADLRRAVLWEPDLRRVFLFDGDLRDAVTYGADFRDADLVATDFRGAVLLESDFRGAKLTGADFRGADLSRADLSGHELIEAQVRGACATHATKWPHGFDPAGSGVRIADDCDAAVLSAPEDR